MAVPRALLLAAMLLAGCAAAPSPAQREPLALPPRVAALEGCTEGCWEPMVAIDPEGRIFVVAGSEQLLSVSEDGGRSFAPLAPPPFPPNMPPATERIDQTIATDPDGRLFFAAFMMLPIPGTPGIIAPSGMGPRALGLQVATSLDHGASWATDVFFSLDEARETNVLTPFKMWLGFAADGTAYLDFNQRPARGVYLGRSDDHGKTWTPFVRVQPDDDRIFSAFFSPPVVDAEGRLLIAYFGDQHPNDPGENSYYFQGEELRLAISKDRGATFRHVVIASAAPPAAVGSAFPSLALDEATGRLSVAYWDGEGQTRVATSPDGGETWSEPAAWGDHTFIGPWAAHRRGGLAVIQWDGDTGDLLLDEGPVESGPARSIVLAHETWPTGDFPHFALDAEDRVAAVVGMGERVDLVWG